MILLPIVIIIIALIICAVLVALLDIVYYYVRKYSLKTYDVTNEYVTPETPHILDEKSGVIKDAIIIEYDPSWNNILFVNDGFIGHGRIKSIAKHLGTKIAWVTKS